MKKNRKTPKIDESVSGRRIINMKYFLTEFKQKAHYNNLFDCKLESCILVGEKRVEMKSQFLY